MKELKEKPLIVSLVPCTAAVNTSFNLVIVFPENIRLIKAFQGLKICASLVNDVWENPSLPLPAPFSTIYRKYQPHLSGSICLSRPLLFIALAALAVTAPILILGFPDSYDQLFALSMQRGFGETLKNGALYPRWVDSLFNGHGSPVFFFYPPLAYYFSAVFGLLKIPALHALGFAAIIGLMLSGGSAYIWLRGHYDLRAALAGALIYIVLPYHLYFNLYVNGSYAEFMAYIFFPLIFAALDRAARAPGPRAAAFIALCYAALIMTHLPTATLLSPFLGLYAMTTVASKDGKIKILLWQTLGGILGLGLASIYLVPALGLLDAVHADFLWQAIDFHDYFLCLPSCTPAQGLKILTAFVLCQFGFALALIVLLFLQNKKTPALIFWSLVYVAVPFLLSQVSAPLWETLPILPKIQLPQRFIILLDLGFVFLITTTIQSGLLKSRRLTIAGYILFVLAVAVTPIAKRYSTLYGDTDRAQTLAAQRQNWTETGAAQLEFLPYHVGGDIKALLQTTQPPFSVTRGSATITLLETKNRSQLYRVDAPGDFTATFKLFYFPGWAAYIETKEGKQKLSPGISRPDGRIQLTLPPGAYNLRMELEKTAPEQLGILLSGLSAFFLVLLLIAGRKKAA